MNWQPYPEYKPSGVEWLGEVPEHWEVGPLRALARSGSKNFTDGDWIESPFIRDEGIRLIQTGNIGIGGYVEQGYRYIDVETFHTLTCTEVFPKNVLICRLADPVGRACLAPDLGCRMITSVDVSILKPAEGVDSAFVVYALSSSDYLSWMSGLCRGGTRDRVSRSMLGAIQLQRPPFEEQQAIAEFLDRETERIDALIEKKRRQIELLQEKRAALITHAVTKGLDPNARMKDSGIEWLGELPAHWVVAPLYARYSLQLGKMLDSKRITGDHLAPYLRNVDVQWGRIKTTDLPEMDFSPEDRLRLALRKGDLLVCEGGEVGRTAIWEGEVEECYYQKALHRLRAASDKDFSRFFFYVMFAAAHTGAFQAGSDVSTIGHLTGEKLRRHRFAFPHRTEQEQITAFLEESLPRLDALAEKVGQSIATLREYRAALISAAVTGKINVRGKPE